MKSQRKYLRGIMASLFVAVGIALILAACPASIQDDSEVPGGADGSKVILSGKAIFANPASSGTITVHLEQTDGLYVESMQPQARSARNAKTTAKSDGSYTFENVGVGIYTIYANSEDETEQAVLINIPVEKNAGEETIEITLEQMTLKPVGSITGRIILDGSNSGNLGFTVFIAGTSYMAVTGNSGIFEISNVPEGSGYEIAVMRGNYATVWSAASVISGEATDLEQFNVTSAEINGDAMMWKGALIGPPLNPQKNWAYFNLNDKITYVYDGAGWQVMAQVITTNTIVYQGNGNTSGNAPVDPGNYVYGIHVEIMGKGNLEREGCRFMGWSREENGSDDRYQAGDTIIIRDTQIVLFATWLPLYTVNYIGNGNTSGTAPDSEKGITGEDITVAGIGSLQRDGYRFMGWSTNQTVSASEYSSGSSFTIGTANENLYAVWSKLYTIIFDGNGHTEGNPPASWQGISGESVLIPANPGNLIRDGYHFLGWSQDQNANTPGLVAGNNLTVSNQNLTVYAVWAKLYTITYDGNGHTEGNPPASWQSISGARYWITNGVNMDKDGYRFMGWSQDKNATVSEYTGGEEIIHDRDRTLYAVWVKPVFPIFKTVTVEDMFQITNITWGGPVGQEQFVAVGYDKKIAYSVDGLTWSVVTDSNFPDVFYSITWGGSVGQRKFVAVGSGSNNNHISYSTDGVNWTGVSSIFQSYSYPTTIAWGGSAGQEKFVAGYYTGDFAYSLDGITWNAVTDSIFSQSNSIKSVTWGGPAGQEKFIAGVSSQGNIAYSSDGIAWTVVTETTLGVNNSSSMNITWGGTAGQEKFVAVGKKVAYSTDGINWIIIGDMPQPFYNNGGSGITFGGISGHKKFITWNGITSTLAAIGYSLLE